MSFSERSLGKTFKAELEKQTFILTDRGYKKATYETGFRVYLNKRLWTHTPKFKRYWQERNLKADVIPPSQPEIDMILVDDYDIMRAVEIKVVKGTRRGIRPSYYVGLGQALAYLSFGFPQVALWQCYDGNSLHDSEIFKYQDAFGKTRAPIQNIVDATFFKISSAKQGLRFETGFFSPFRRWWEQGIGKPQNGKHAITWVSVNPLLKGLYSLTGDDVSRRIVALNEYLQEQRTLWES